MAGASRAIRLNGRTFPCLLRSKLLHGPAINRTLTRHAELSFSTFFWYNFDGELLKQVAMDGCGIARLPEYAIDREVTDGRLIVNDADRLVYSDREA